MTSFVTILLTFFSHPTHTHGHFIHDQVLVPVIPVSRPFIANEPFSTFIVLNRTQIPASERFFLYPVHVSVSFLLTKGINSAMYLMLLRFLHRDYAQVFRLADSVATDTKLNTEGQAIFANLSAAASDAHPDSHACRMKISLVTADSGMTDPWNLSVECFKHSIKLDSVSSTCRFAPGEERQLFESGKVALSTASPSYGEKYSTAVCFNRLQMLRELDVKGTAETGPRVVDIEASIPPRELTNNWNYYSDNTVFGEKYLPMQEITSVDEGEHSWMTEVTYICILLRILSASLTRCRMHTSDTSDTFFFG